LKSRPNVCMEPECFKGKCQAHYAEQAEKFRAAGHTVTTMKAIDQDEVEYQRATNSIRTLNEGWKNPKELLGKHLPKPVIAVDDEGVHEYYAMEDIRAAAKKAKVELFEPEPEPAAGLSPAQHKAKEEKRLAERKAADELEVRKRAFVATLLPALAKALAKVKDAIAWEAAEILLVEFGYDSYGDTDDFEAALVKGVKATKARYLGRLLSNSDAHPVQGSGDWNEAAMKAWKLVGIDLVAEWAKAEKVAQAVLTLLAKPKLEQAKLLDVPAGKKFGKKELAKLKAAQKERWAKIQKAKK